MIEKPISRWWRIIINTVIIIFYLLPIYVIVNMSFKEGADLLNHLAFPSRVVVKNYKIILYEGKFIRAFLNTVITAVIPSAACVFLGCMAAFPIARNKTKLNSAVNSIFMGVMMIPGQSVLVGLYHQFVKMHGINHLWSVIAISTAFGIPVAVLLYSNFIRSIPDSLDDAAALDGAGALQIFWHIILPQLKPITATIVIQQVVGNWNNYVYPSYFLQKPSKYTLVLLISQYFGNSETAAKMGTASAVAVCASLPMIILFFSLQKYFVEGSIDAAVK